MPTAASSKDHLHKHCAHALSRQSRGQRLASVRTRASVLACTPNASSTLGRCKGRGRAAFRDSGDVKGAPAQAGPRAAHWRGGRCCRGCRPGRKEHRRPPQIRHRAPRRRLASCCALSPAPARSPACQPAQHIYSTGSMHCLVTTPGSLDFRHSAPPSSRRRRLPSTWHDRIQNREAGGCVPCAR